jgi:hypothetical protein
VTEQGAERHLGVAGSIPAGLTLSFFTKLAVIFPLFDSFLPNIRFIGPKTSKIPKSI